MKAVEGAAARTCARCGDFLGPAEGPSCARCAPPVVEGWEPSYGSAALALPIGALLGVLGAASRDWIGGTFHWGTLLAAILTCAAGMFWTLRARRVTEALRAWLRLHAQLAGAWFAFILAFGLTHGSLTRLDMWLVFGGFWLGCAVVGSGLLGLLRRIWPTATGA